MRRTCFFGLFLVSMLVLGMPITAIGQEGDEEKEPQVTSHGPISFNGSNFNGSLPDGITGEGSESDPFIITGHWINSTDSPGILIENSSFHFVIQTNLFTNNETPDQPAILLSNSSNVLINMAYIYYFTRGVEVLNCSNIRIERSGSFGCRDGIYVQGADIVIESCLLKVNVESGIFINRSSRVRMNNIISDGNTAILGVTSGIHIMDSNDVKIENTTCSLNYGYGILVEPSSEGIMMDRIEISGSYIDSNNNGIVMKNIRSVKVYDTIMQHNTNGLYLRNAGSFQVAHCRFYKNTYGIFLSDSKDTVIRGSMFDRNENGIYLDSTNDSVVRECFMSNGTWHAITVDTWLGMGPASSDNLFYSNHFIDNGPIGSQVMDNGENNSWYLDSEGNTWSDHWGPDADNDTLVDDPYVINGLANATDEFPVAWEKGDVFDDNDNSNEVNEIEEKPDRYYYWLIVSITMVIFFILSGLIMVQKRSSIDL